MGLMPWIYEHATVIDRKDHEDGSAEMEIRLSHADYGALMGKMSG
jgi:hypothetical protein